MTLHPIIAEDVARIAAAPLPWDQLRGKTVLISGACGFLPSYMVGTLLHLNDVARLGVRVIGLVRDPAKARARFAFAEGRSDLSFLFQDVCVPVPPDVRAEVVIHAASKASPRFYGEDPIGTLSANTLGTFNMLELARRSSSQSYLGFSSSEVYGTVHDEPANGLSETDFGYLDPAEVRSCYAESKRLGETMAVSWHKQHGVPTRIVRPFHTYGPGLALDDGRVFADFVADIVARRPIVVRSPGTAYRAFCYVSDAVIGFFTVLFRGLPGQAYNVGNPKGELSIRELAELLVGLVPEYGLKVEYRDQSSAGYLASTVRRNQPNINKTRSLGWWPTILPAEGFRRMIRSYS